MMVIGLVEQHLQRQDKIGAYAAWLQKLDKLVLVKLRELLDYYPPTPEEQQALQAYLQHMVEVAANLFEARADYTADLMDRADALLSAIDLSPNRGDIRLKLGATYVELKLWPEALEQLRVAGFFLPLEEHERVDRLVETADKAYQARFLPPDVTE